MTNLIDYTYFKNNIHLPNTNDADVRTYIAGMVTRWQYDFLQKIMGPALYEQFEDWYAVDPSDTTNIFYYLLNGKTFVEGGKSYNWVGLVNTLKTSPLANYVYYRIQENNITQTTSTGEVKTNAQYSAPSVAMPKMVGAWNEMAEWLCTYGIFMDTFFGTSGTLENNYSALPYKSPIQIQADATTGLTSGTNTFTFDGAAGKYDWRGYEMYPERIGQGTMVRGRDYSWNVNTGKFDLLLSGDVFQPLEFFNVTFGRGGIVFQDITSNAAWAAYRYEANEKDVFNYKNALGI
jgi:hypothetical protein